MSLMAIRLELGRSQDTPSGDRRHGYEFIAPLDQHGHLDATEWSTKKDKCGVRCFRPAQTDRKGMLRHVGRGWKFDYIPGRTDDDEPIFHLDQHVIAPGLYISIMEEDGVQRPFKVAAVTRVKA
jgi:hypothetical protein